MPWSGQSFREKHNKKLAPEAAKKAAAQANAMIRDGVPEGQAIATANKHGNKLSSEERAKRRYRDAD